MPGPLAGFQVAIITSNTGVEHDELVVPRDRLRERGAQVLHAAVKSEPVHTYRHDLEPADTFDPDTTIDSLDPTEVDILVIPGGTVNADRLRTDPHACALIRALTSAGV
uniref:DJ-1/PfpI family protein n=1 Tax=Nocardia concava TaxID=257281 RepID=UPI000594FCC2